MDNDAQSDLVSSQNRDQLILELEGFEGPLDMLLALAREQKVDLLQLSILQLADQYIKFVETAREMKLELAADYLVMAAWLAYLKSRLLLPKGAEDEEPSGEEMAVALAYQLKRYETVKSLALNLVNRPRLGRDIFSRGEPEGIRNTRKTIYDVSLYELLKAYTQNQNDQQAQSLTIEPHLLFAVEDCSKRLQAVLGSSKEWVGLVDCLPKNIKGSLMLKSALASTLSASLELAKNGGLEIQQKNLYGPIFLKNPMTSTEKESQDG
jgi:segregation and condensation protein A